MKDPNKLRRLMRLLMWQGILSHNEARAAILSYRADDDYACEAVDHYGGTKRLIHEAWLNRHNILGLQKLKKAHDEQLARESR